MYSKPYLKLATLPCRLGVQAGLKWLSDIKKTSGCRYNSCLPRKKTWFTHLFSAMGVPGDVRVSGVRCQVSGKRNREAET
jgi:hypothetical protein